MPEILEHFGTQCQMPEPDIVGDCDACGGEMYEYEHRVCDCGKEVHEDCLVVCEYCGHKGCKGCMVEGKEIIGWFCGAECEEELLKAEAEK